MMAMMTRAQAIDATNRAEAGTDTTEAHRRVHTAPHTPRRHAFDWIWSHVSCAITHARCGAAQCEALSSPG